MQERPKEERILASFRAYVEGEDAMQQTISNVHGVDESDLAEVLEQHRDELEEIDAGRAAILESIYRSFEERGL